MSHRAVAAALSLQNVSAGERLAAFSLASFANREQRSWPGWRVAAARAGLSKSQYLASREGLERRGLIAVQEPGGGRGNACVIAVRFAELGPWFDGDVNAALFEAVLGYSRLRGSARLLLATLAALADEQRSVNGLAVDAVRAAAGMAESTYRRAHEALLASGELVLELAGGGRGRMNRWLLCDPRAINPEPAVGRPRRVAPCGGQRPLIVPARGTAGAEAQARVQNERAAAASEVAGELKRGPRLPGVSALKGAQSRTVSQSKTPPLTPPETPPPNARAGREPQNHRTDPPNPPKGGSSSDQVLVEKKYVSDRGRTRRRLVPVDLAAVRARLETVGAADLAAWKEVRDLLLQAVGQSMVEIWLDSLELLAVDHNGTLIVSAPEATVSWVGDRYGRLLDHAAERAGRRLRLADEVERTAAKTLVPITAIPPPHGASVVSSGDAEAAEHVESDACAAEGPADVSAGTARNRSGDPLTDRSGDRTVCTRGYRSAYLSSHIDVYNQVKEASR